MFVVGDLARLGRILECFVIVRWISTSPLESFAPRISNVDPPYNHENRAPDRPVSASCTFTPCRITAQNSKKAGLRADLVAGWPHVAHSRGFLSVEAEFSPISGRL